MGTGSKEAVEEIVPSDAERTGVAVAFGASAGRWVESGCFVGACPCEGEAFAPEEKIENRDEILQNL